MSIMRNVFFTFIIIAVCGCASAPRHSLDHLIKGEYAFYLDTRDNESYYRGYMYSQSDDGKRLISVRNVNANTGYEEHFSFNIDDDESGYPIVVSNIRSREPHKLDIRQSIHDFLSFTTLYLRTRDDYHLQSNIRNERDDYTLVFSFNKALPFFGFYDIKPEGDNEAKYTLLHAGMLSSDRLEYFYEMTPFIGKSEITEQRQILEIPLRNEKVVEQNGVRLTLDENWYFHDDNSAPFFFLSLAGNAIHSEITTYKTTFRNINSVSEEPNLTRENFYLYFRRGFLYMSRTNALEIDTLNILQTENGYQYEFYFSEGNIRRYMRRICIINGNDVYIINFSSFADIYDNNKDYYQRILNSVVVNRR
jgi:hypothetical protein